MTLSYMYMQWFVFHAATAMLTISDTCENGDSCPRKLRSACAAHAAALAPPRGQVQELARPELVLLGAFSSSQRASSCRRAVPARHRRPQPPLLLLYEQLCNAGFGVLAYDLLSHGASDSDHHGLRAHGAKFHYFVDDTNEFIKMAKTELYPKLSLSTDNEPKMIWPGCLMARVFARPLSKLVPKARIVPGVNADFLCRDQDYLDDFKADPLTVSEPVTARMGAETLKAMRALEADKRVEDKDSALCKLPILMMMGSNDKRLATRDKEFKVFDGYFHALFETRSVTRYKAQIAEEPKVEVADVTPVVENVETETTVVGEVKVETTASATEETKVEVTTAQEHKSETVNSDTEKEEPAAVGSSDKSLRRMRLKSKLTKRNEDEGSAS
ncbi:Alpha/Beta hydrolase fold [Phytophthora cactorum]|nr:Alpha/Beta hydrolase fold [Phytophthora cactorum]